MTQERSTIKLEVIAASQELGFRGCAFTHARPLDCGPTLDNWIGAARHASMDWMERAPAARLEPALHLNQAKSVMVLAWPYELEAVEVPDWRGQLLGRIAAYAMGSDYHIVLRDKLEQLSLLIKNMCGAASLCFVDGGPLVEKDLAKRAGLGWFGHNTNILTPELGSSFLVGLIVSEADIEPDAPFTASHCGSCRACLPACPTGALDNGPTIDANLCISYLTIEHRGPIKHNLRKLMGSWIFGCDVCQQVCPWNSEKSRAVARPELWPNLGELLKMTTDQFRERFVGTAVLRAKRRGLARNAAIALANTGNPAAVEPLERALFEHDEALVRAHAAWGLGRLGAKAAARALEQAVDRENIAPVLTEIGLAISAFDPPAAE